MFWWEKEVEPEGWKNPIRKVKEPKVGLNPLEPVPLDTLKTLINVCPRDNFNGIRDKAIFLCLLDTGATNQKRERKKTTNRIYRPEDQESHPPIFKIAK